VTELDIDKLRRELLIASSAARKLSVALSIAWAELTNVRFSGSLRNNETGVRPDAHKEKDSTAEPGLPF